MTYTVEVSPAARRQLRRFPLPVVQERVTHALDSLVIDPRPPGVLKMAGSERDYGIRVGTYRVVYEIHDEALLVLVISVAHRRNVYR